MHFTGNFTPAENDYLHLQWSTEIKQKLPLMGERIYESMSEAEYEAARF